MSAILLFCTAEVPGRVIEKLMAECAIPENADNMFSLVRTPDQASLDEWATSPPIADFATGFASAPDAQLRALVEPLIKRSTGGASTSLAGDWLAVLDDKSEEQGAVVLHYSYALEDWDEQPIVGPAEVVDGTIWWKWRVPFKAAWTLWNAVDSCGYDGIELYSREEYRDAEGVLQTEIPDKILAGEMADPKQDEDEDEEDE
ncbi:hypothetical protein ISF_08850 [Cordyceps fumosorosea ARSEF 2679]|uniref:Uncharacterized protein n=1 Tax=Cordyceps fumosorosea (strain ARSEF 2679) TaxID=1081104 RepID=A0A167LQD4_CORFA|nr:hypothetical protein ISF_08850 [Cordyceps fumosorosea ARSEF 2679]OAA53369.1 hypothetical protein ISF_08850 [Cordyceps fumosorosea ARSEF 2679]